MQAGVIKFTHRLLVDRAGLMKALHHLAAIGSLLQALMFS
jgi:hypothetical protein